MWIFISTVSSILSNSMSGSISSFIVSLLIKLPNSTFLYIYSICLGVKQFYLNYYFCHFLLFCYFCLISDNKVNCGGIISTFYKFKLSLVSTRVIVCSSSSVSIRGVWNIVWSSSMLNMCCVCSASLFACLDGHSLAKWSYSLHLKHLILPLFVLALETDPDLLLLALLLPLICLSYDLVLFLP